MNKKQAIEYIVHGIHGELSEEKAEELRSFLEAHPEFRSRIEQLEGLGDELNELGKHLDEIASETHRPMSDHLNERLHEVTEAKPDARSGPQSGRRPKRTSRRSRFGRYRKRKNGARRKSIRRPFIAAAALLLLVLMGSVLFFNTTSENDEDTVVERSRTEPEVHQETAEPEEPDTDTNAMDEDEEPPTRDFREQTPPESDTSPDDTSHQDQDQVSPTRKPGQREEERQTSNQTVDERDEARSSTGRTEASSPGPEKSEDETTVAWRPVIKRTAPGAKVVRDGERLDARNGMKINAHDTVQVPRDQQVTLQYPREQTRIQLSGNTRAELWKEGKMKRIHLEEGELEGDVETQTRDRSMVLTTPMARAEVVGTRFSLSAKQTTRLGVSEGTVRLDARQSNRSVMVETGDFAEVGRNTPLTKFDLNEGLIGYWPFDDGGGTTAVDCSPLENDGTINGDPTRTGKGQVGDALKFDGEDDYVEIPHVEEYVLEKGTISFWFRAEALTPKTQAISWLPSDLVSLWSKDASSYGTGGHLSINLRDSRLKVDLESSNKSNMATVPRKTRTGRWYHLAFTFGSAGMRVYLNGKVLAKNNYRGGLGSTSGGAGNGKSIYIGAFSGYRKPDRPETRVTHHFQGRIDEVRFYARVLSEPEVRCLAEQ